MGFAGKPGKRPWWALIVVLTAVLPVWAAGHAVETERGIYYVEGRTGQVALTFNTLWSSRGLSQILDVLAQEGVQATFFVSGTWLRHNQEDARKILLAGHEIGNRTVSNTPLLYLDEHSLVREISDFNHLSRQMLEYRPRLFRPPQGEYSGLVQRVARQENCSLVLWSVESYDWLSEDCAELSQRVLEKARGGAIVLFRVGAPALAGALPEIITSLREDGYELVTVSRLLP